MGIGAYSSRLSLRQLDSERGPLRHTYRAYHSHHFTSPSRLAYDKREKK